MRLKEEIEKMEFYNPGITTRLKLSQQEVNNLTTLFKKYALSLIPKKVPADKQNEYYQGYHACRQQMVERNK